MDKRLQLASCYRDVLFRDRRRLSSLVRGLVVHGFRREVVEEVVLVAGVQEVDLADGLEIGTIRELDRGMAVDLGIRGHPVR